MDGNIENRAYNIITFFSINKNTAEYMAVVVIPYVQSIITVVDHTLTYLHILYL
jgi:hypothetical protein